MQWTYVTRERPFGPFFVPSHFVGTWDEASEAGRRVVDNLDVWIVPADAIEVEVAEGRTVRIRDIAAERAERKAITDLVAHFDRAQDWEDWLIRGARRFGGYQGADRREAAASLLAYFRSDRDGMRPITSPAEIRSAVLRSFS